MWTTDSIVVTTFALAFGSRARRGYAGKGCASRRIGRATMIATSILIPPLAVFWRLVGAIRFGALVA